MCQSNPPLKVSKQVVLKAVMLRRTKKTEIDGKPLIELPEREIVLVKGPFLDE